MLVSSDILEAGIKLRVEQDERRIGGAHRGYAIQHAVAERGLVLSGDGVVWFRLARSRGRA